MDSPEITLSEYWRIFRKQKNTFILTFFMVLVSTVIFTKLQTPVYKTSLELKIEKKQPVAAFIRDEKEQKANPFGLPVKEVNLSTELRLIKSLPVLSKVAEKMEVLPADREERQKRVHEISLGYQNRVSVEQVGDTEIVSISVVSNDPQNASLMAEAISDVYIGENVESRKRQLKSVLKYVDDQATEAKKLLAEEEVRLQKFNQNEKVFEVTKNIKETLDRLTVEGSFEFEAEMIELDEELKNLSEILAQKNTNETYQLFEKKILQENYIFIGLRRRLLELEFERFLLLIDYTEKHPAIIQQDKTIASMKNKIVQILKNISGIEITPEVESYLAFIVKKVFAENRREVLVRIINGFYGDEGSLSVNQLEYVRLKRNVDRLLNSYDRLDEQRQSIRLKLANVIDDVITVVSPAFVPKKPIKPDAKVNYMVSSVVGLLLGIMFCFVRESLDGSVSTIRDVEHELNLSMLGIIPHMAKDEVLQGRPETAEGATKKTVLQRARLVTITAPKSWASESLKMLRTNLIQLFKSNNFQSVLFTSSDKQEGKSTVVTNLAISMAQLGKKTILVGSNLRRPTVHKIFGLSRNPGLSDVLMQNISWREALNKPTDILTGGINVDDLLKMPGIDNLNILTCGHPVDNVSELLASKAFDQLLAELKANYDVVIIDCSPVMAVPDAITLCSRVDGVVLVYKVGHTSKDILERAKANLIKAGTNLFGIVLNDIRTEAQIGYSAYYYRYYAETDDPSKKSLFDRWKNKEKNTA